MPWQLARFPHTGAPAMHPALTHPALTPPSVLAIAGVVVFFLVLGAVLAVAWLRMPPEHDDDDDVDSGPGGGGSSRGPQPGGGGPAWWPEFERQFAAHVEVMRRPAIERTAVTVADD